MDVKSINLLSERTIYMIIFIPVDQMKFLLSIGPYLDGSGFLWEA